MKRQLSDIFLIVIVILVGLFAFVDLSRRIYTSFAHNKGSNIRIETVQDISNPAEDFFVKSFIRQIENNNNLSRVEKDRLVESYLYNEKIKTDIKNTGYLNKFGNKQVKASFEIDKDGHINNSKILESSNDKSTDKKVLKAIKGLNPYKPIPAIYNGNSKYVEFTYSNGKIIGFTTYPTNNPCALEELQALSNNEVKPMNYDFVHGSIENFETEIAKKRDEYIKKENERYKKENEMLKKQKFDSGKQGNLPELEMVSDEEQLHGLDKFALERVSSTDKGPYTKQTVYTTVGDRGELSKQKISPIDAAEIESAWNPPMNKPSNVKIIFTVTDDGTIKDIMLASSSGIPKADEAALEAVKNAKAKPFKIPYRHYIDVAMWFQVGNFK